MYYVDTNIAVTALTPEPQQKLCSQWLVDHQEQVHLSDWVIAEFASALSIKVRSAQLTDSDSALAARAFDRYVDASVAVLPLQRDDFRTAAQWCRDPEIGLRAGDALHLAVAASHQLTLVTRDRAMAASADALGLAAQLLQEES